MGWTRRCLWGGLGKWVGHGDVWERLGKWGGHGDVWRGLDKWGGHGDVWRRAGNGVDTEVAREELEIGGAFAGYYSNSYEAYYSSYKT